jgi:hypothetical protein
MVCVLFQFVGAGYGMFHSSSHACVVVLCFGRNVNSLASEGGITTVKEEDQTFLVARVLGVGAYGFIQRVGVEFSGVVKGCA